MNCTIAVELVAEFINEGFRYVYRRFTVIQIGLDGSLIRSSNVMVLGWDNLNQCRVENFVRDVVIPCLNGGPHISSFVQ